MGRILFNEKGVVHLLSLLLIIVAIGIISFLLISSTAPVGGLFNILNPKPKSHAQEMMMGSPFMNNDCGLPNQAFCDTFDTPFMGGGRTGELDPNRWSVGRFGGFNGAGWANGFVPSKAMHCKDQVTRGGGLAGVLPDNDYFMCGAEFGESEHFMESFDAGTQYDFNDAMVTQPFDFANRTGTVIWDVDNNTSGGHGWWTEFWITDQPTLGPHVDTFVTHPQNAIGLAFSGGCGDLAVQGTDAGGSTGAVASATIFRNYVRSDSTGSDFTSTWTADKCYHTAPDSLNHMKLLISKDRIEVWATDDGDETFNYKLRTVFTGLNLQFSRGYIHLEHAAYNPDKARPGGVTQFKTYHWDTVGFDGPVIQPDAHYAFPDSLTDAPFGGKNTGYVAAVNTPVTVSNVNLTGAKSATLAFSAYIDNTAFTYSVNGHPHVYSDPHGVSGEDDIIAVPVDLSELKNGTNTISFSTSPGNYWQGPIIANIDLFINGAPQPNYVTFDQPTQGVNFKDFIAPATVPISVSVSPQAPATSISKVVLTQGSTVLATLTQAPFTFNWSNVPIGRYTLTATATDNLGNVATGSTVVSVISALPLFVEPYLTNIPIYTSNPTPNGITVNWTTDKLSDSQVEYGPTTSYGSSTPVDSNQVTTHTVNLTGLNNFQIYHYRVKSRNAAGLSTSADQVFETPITSNITSPWTSQNIGNLDPYVGDIMGSANLTNGVFTMQSNGITVDDGPDSMRYTYQTISGDATIVARVSSLAERQNPSATVPWAEAALMIRDSINPSAMTVAMGVDYSDGIHFQKRPWAGGKAEGSNDVKVAGLAAPYYIKLQRQGDTFTGFSSPDGVTWTQVGSQTFSMPQVVYTGLAVASLDPNALVTATFDHVSISGSTATPAPTTSGVPTPTPTPAPTSTPPSGPATVDDSISGSGFNQFNYVGNWQHCTSCGSNLFNNSNSWDGTTNDTVTFKFNGTQILFYGVNDPAHGIGAVSIDNGTETMVDFYNPNRAGNQLLWTSPVLTLGVHTLKVRVTGTHNPNSGGVLVVPDRVDVLSNPAPSSSCAKASLGDVDCDGTIGIFDFNILVGNFGKTGSSIQGDFNGDGSVGIFDYNILVGNFGK